MVNDAADVVPFGPITSSGSVIVVVVEGGGGDAGEAVRVRVAVPRTALVDEFFAVAVTVVCVATVLGAV
jgi:hypothetical protein